MCENVCVCARACLCVSEHVWMCVSMCGCACVHVWLCVYVRVHVSVCVSMWAGLDGGLLAGWISWQFGMGMGFRQEDATVVVVAKLGFETSFYG